MKILLLGFLFLSTVLLARPDDWAWLGQAQQARRGVVIPQSDFHYDANTDNGDLGIGFAFLFSRALEGLKTKYDCEVVDTSEGRLAFVCFEDETVVVFCDIDLESFEMDCVGG